MKINKFTLLVLFAMVFASQSSTAQSSITDNDLGSIKRNNVRAYASFYIPPTRLQDFSADLNVAGTYNIGNRIQARGGLAVGTFTGVKLGASYYLRASQVTRNHRFVVSRSKSGRTETVTYFREKAKGMNYFGPAVDVQIGRFSKAGFYFKSDFGLEWVFARKAFADYKGRRIGASSNGNLSVKAQAVLLNSMYGSPIYNLLERRTAAGFQIAPSFTASPWRRITLHGGLPFGYAKYLGTTLSKYGDDIEKGIYILSIDLGLSYNF